ncbi:MAG: TfoX/Sxy family protein [Sporichthyaceae bacterium]
MDLLDRVRLLLPDAQEKRMFGAVAFMVDGALAVAVGADGLMVRVAPQEQAALVEQDGVTPMTMRERVSRGWVRVETTALEGEEELGEWVARGAARARAV